MHTIKVLLFLTLLIIPAVVFSQQIISIGGIEDLGVTIDPITYQRGNNIYDTTQMCLYEDIYQIPCGMSISPADQTSITVTSTSYERSFDYTDDQYSNVNIDVGVSFMGFKANGKYSSSVTSNAETMTKTDTSLLVSEVNVQLFDMTTDTISMKFNPDLIGMIENCVNADQLGDSSGFSYWINQLFSEFKPGVIVQGTSGAKLKQLTYVFNSYYHSTDTTVVKNSASASCSYAGMFNADGSYNWGATTSEIQTFQKNINSFSANAIGGEYTDGISLANWEDSVYNNPVLLDYTIDLSLFWLQPEVWPQYSATSINRILQTFIDTYLPYFGNNTHPGCTDPYGMNFNLKYNVDDGSCNYSYPTTSTWGSKFTYGTYYDNPIPYQTNPSKPQNLWPNLLTGGKSCPTSTAQYCYSFYYDYDPKHQDGDYLRTWQNVFCDCNGDINNPNSVAFGGFYSQTEPNPITGKYNCPSGMIDNGGWCYGTNVPSAVYGGMYRVLGDNAYTSSDNNQNCFSPNPYTNGCSCPSWAPIQFFYSSLSYDDDIACYWSFDEYLCMQKAPFIIGENSGNPAVYIQPNLTIAQTQISPSTSTTSSTTSHYNHHSSHHHGRMIEYILIGIFSCIGLIIFICGIWLFCHCKNRLNGYDPIV